MKNIDFFKSLKKYNKESIHSAGPRYSLIEDESFPNLPISSLSKNLSGLCGGDNFKKHLNPIINKLESSISNVESKIASNFDKSKLLTLLNDLLTCPLRNSESILRKAAKSLSEAKEVFQKCFDEEGEINLSKEDGERVKANLVKFHNSLDDIESFFNSPACQLLHKNVVLILGKWGVGKTHFLCNFTEKPNNEDCLVSICLAKDFSSANPLLDISKKIGFNSFEAFLEKFSECQKENNVRQIFIVDGINEGKEEYWKTAIAEILKLSKKYPMIGFILSCREPFDEIIINKKQKKQLIEIFHKGFDENQIYDAQRAFFEWYKLPFPDVPLLSEEFSRPLTLKLICKTLEKRNTKQIKSWMRGFSSGQKGMTDILEDFIQSQGSHIEKHKKFTLGKKFYWNLLKKEHGISALMAKNKRDYLTERECRKVIDSNLSSVNSSVCRNEFYHELIFNGLIVKDTLYNGKKKKNGALKFETIIRLPYQKFSDCLIARSFLGNFNYSSELSIKEGLISLEEIFKKGRFEGTFNMPGLAEAIIHEFPERSNKRELFYFLSKSQETLDAYAQPFIDGLAWRSLRNFSAETYELINKYLNHCNKNIQHSMLDALVNLALKNKSPCSAKTLYDFLSKFNMNDRDLLWSEFLRETKYQTVDKLIDWIEYAIPPTATALTKNLIILFSLFLTTNDFSLRDRATRILVYLGEFDPFQLFQHTIRTFDFNDPYVSERMLAASYGVGMSLWAVKRKSIFKREFIILAQKLFQEMFMPKGKYLTCHILKREYAKGIIELAIKIDRTIINRGDLKYLNSPFNKMASIFEGQINIQENEFYPTFSEMERIKHLIKGSDGYNHNSSDYKKVMIQIRVRMNNLRYDKKNFENIDNSIQHTAPFVENRYGEKGSIIQYAEKYSQIACFEIYGLRQLENLLGKQRPDEIDIDPSFPQQPCDTLLPIPNILEKAPNNPIEWMTSGILPEYEKLLCIKDNKVAADSWVLLNGYIRQAKDSREIYTFLRGLLIESKHVKKLKKQFQKKSPSNGEIPSPSSTYCLFFGEIPWSFNYGYDIRRKNGRTIRNIEKAYGIKLEVPVWNFLWESHHSQLNQLRNLEVPSPNICEYLKLQNCNRNVELFDEKGKKATRYYIEGLLNDSNFSHLLYLRKDLLKKYLEINKQEIVWIVWGERDSRNFNDPERFKVFKNGEHIHKQFFESKI